MTGARLVTMTRSQTLTLRAARDQDRELRFPIFKLSLGPYVAQTYGGWDEDRQRSRFLDTLKPETHQIIERAGEPIGLLSVVRASDVIELNRVFLLPPFQGQGI